jgi:hypothetical protein
MTSDADLRPSDAPVIAKSSTGLPPIEGSRLRDWDDLLDLKGARLLSEQKALHDGRLSEALTLRRVVVLLSVLLGALYAFGIWIIFTAI